MPEKLLLEACQGMVDTSMRRLGKLFQAFLSSGRPMTTCPHCLLPIGGSKNVCPNCHRLLRFEGIAELRGDQPS